MATVALSPCSHIKGAPVKNTTAEKFDAAAAGAAVARGVRAGVKSRTILVTAAAESMQDFRKTLQVAVDLVYVADKPVKDSANAAFRSLKAMASSVAGLMLWAVSIKGGIVSVEEARIKDEEAEAADESGDVDASEDAAADALWAAVELVLANLGNPAVLSAIRSGLEGLANTKGRN